MRVLDRLREAFGPPAPPPVREPFAVVVWENCSYLVDDDRRAGVYRALERRIGIDPAKIAAAPTEALRALLRPGGMNLEGRVEKLRRAAETALGIGLETLRRSVDEDPAAARRLLKRFPGIGEPGADKILLLAGSQASLAPDSNALRVAQRLGYGEEARDYAHAYRSSVAAVADEIAADCEVLIEAGALLRRHGQTICRRSAPRCEACPVSEDCAYFAENGGG